MRRVEGKVPPVTPEISPSPSNDQASLDSFLRYLEGEVQFPKADSSFPSLFSGGGPTLRGFGPAGTTADVPAMGSFMSTGVPLQLRPGDPGWEDLPWYMQKYGRGGTAYGQLPEGQPFVGPLPPSRDTDFKLSVDPSGIAKEIPTTPLPSFDVSDFLSGKTSREEYETTYTALFNRGYPLEKELESLELRLGAALEEGLELGSPEVVQIQERIAALHKELAPIKGQMASMSRVLAARATAATAATTAAAKEQAGFLSLLPDLIAARQQQEQYTQTAAITERNRQLRLEQDVATRQQAAALIPQLFPDLEIDESVLSGGINPALIPILIQLAQFRFAQKQAGISQGAARPVTTFV